VLLAAWQRDRAGATATLDSANPNSASPALVLNGYNVVPSSTEYITAFYGMYTAAPAVAATVQGHQEFDLVDPVTGEPVGTFDALVSKNETDTFGGSYLNLLVTENLSGTPGTGAGDIPPVGSVMATYNIFGFGIHYSTMPSPSGAVVSLDVTTPFGDFSVPYTWDASAGIADHTVDNRPIQLANGYYIAPEDPLGETFTAITGFQPFFVAVQGKQTFNVFQAGTDVPVGSFEAVMTPTSDTLGIYTEALLVTSTNESTNVGTEAGDVPPVGSVFNVIYLWRDDTYLLYSSLPSSSGDVISLKLVTPFGDIDVPTEFNASKRPPVELLTTPEGYDLVPASTMQVSGVNGLPPREVSIQGYQQFDVYNSAGARIGSFDAQVSNQSSWDDTYSAAVLVTNVTSGTAGTDPGDVPPVGSVFNFIYYGDSGLGTAYSAKPSQSGDVISYTFPTPVGNIPLFTTYDAAEGLPGYSFFNPFLSDDQVSFNCGNSGLGALMQCNSGVM